MPAVVTNVSVPTLCVHQPLDSVAKLNYTYRNQIINGRFEVWQRGTSFALASPAYTADRWYIDLVGNVTRQSFLTGESELMDNSRYYLKTNPAGSAASYIEQRVESAWTLAGKQTTLTFWAKAGIGGSLIVSMIQNFGTGGTPSTAVTTAMGAVTLTTAWTKYTLTVTAPTIASKVMGTGGNDYVAIRFNLPVDDVYLCNVQWEYGPLSTTLELRPLDEELRLCRRFYEQFDLAINQLGFFGVMTGTTQANFLFQYQEKRAIPTVTVPDTFRIYLNGDTPIWTDSIIAKQFANKLAAVSTGSAAGTVVVGNASAACSILINAEL